MDAVVKEKSITVNHKNGGSKDYLGAKCKVKKLCIEQKKISMKIPWYGCVAVFDYSFVVAGAASPVPEHVTYLIVGAGTASVAAFRAIKSRDAKAKVSICMNSYYIF